MKIIPLMLMALAGCCGAAPTAGVSRTAILTASPSLHSLTARVAQGSPRWEVIHRPPSAPGFQEAAARAEAVVAFRSLPVPGQDRVYAEARRANIRIVEIDPAVAWNSEVPKLPLIADPVDSAHGKAPEEPEPNPHVWLSLSHAVRLTEAITRDLMRLDPEHQALYRSNADRLQRELRSLKAEYERKLSTLESLSVASLTEAFPYLCADFGIHVADYLLEHGDVAEVTARVKSARVKVVLAEEAPEKKVAEAVATAGARVVVLDTLEEGEASLDGYLSRMRANLDKLVEVLGR